jgi:hypothetical protein
MSFLFPLAPLEPDRLKVKSLRDFADAVNQAPD